MSDALAEPMITYAAKKPKTDEENTKNQQDQALVFPQDMEIEDIDMPDDTLIDILTQIKNENKSVVPQPNVQDPPKSNSVVNVSSFANISHVNRQPLMPTMYFPNSNVTINYHFHNKD